MSLPKLLTRQMLNDWGIIINQTGDNQYDVFYKGRLLTQKVGGKEHKYGQTKYYVGIVFNGRPWSFARVLYAYFNGEAPAEMDVDHIDNDPFNNRLDNLQLLTRRENLIKRPLTGINQWKNIKNYSDDSWNKLVANNKEKRNK